MTDEGPVPRLLLGGLDEILSDFDTILPDDPEAVVRAFVQAGGNGGGEAAAVFQEWAGSLGVADAQDVMAALLALHARAGPAGRADLAALIHAARGRWPVVM